MSGISDALGSAKRAVQAAPFLLPTVFTGVVIALTVGSYQPLVADETALASSVSETPTLESVSVGEDSSTSDTDTSSLGLDLSTIADGTYTGSAAGFQSTITVRVTVKDHKITAVEVVSHGDTEAYFNRATAVIDSVLSQQSISVDTISGATYSSKGILMAIRNALTGETYEDSGSSGATGASSSSPASDTGYTPGKLKDGVYEGTEYGFQSDITVSVTISGGKITAIDIVSQGDTAAYFNRATAVIDSIISAQSTAVDAISGATYSSEGIKGAVKNALLKAGADDDSSSSGDSDSSSSSSDSNNSSNSGGSTSDSGDDSTSNASYEDGEWVGYALCENGDDAEAFSPYYVAVKVKIENGVVTGITDVWGSGTTDSSDDADLGEFDEDNETYLGYAKDGRTYRGTSYVGVVEQLLSGTTPSGIDVVTRSTWSSRAIAEAYKNALKKAAKSACGVAGCSCTCEGCTGSCCNTSDSGSSTDSGSSSDSGSSTDTGGSSDSGGSDSASGSDSSEAGDSSGSSSGEETNSSSDGTASSGSDDATTSSSGEGEGA